MRIYSWNVNGIRAIMKKGFLDWIEDEKPDILCVQETKAHPDQLSFELKEVDDYQVHFASAKKAGYSGTATYSRMQTKKVQIGLGEKRFDQEGRTIISYYPNFVLFNIYFPNGKASKERLAYKMDYYYFLLDYLKKIKKEQKNIIITGDVNTAHKEIDLARPKANEKISGFLKEEREWIDQLLDSGFIDSYRHFYPKKTDAYTWWSLRTAARKRNVGWRIDYFLISEPLIKNLKAAKIHDQVKGSDHCPISIEVQF
ncbi:MAG: exodeoxyribonuclease III [Candidatus Pacebacteria bacterium]|jgi:exodeoxyribonuclease-3|nr:exodeoxyribonuclease III [Candidatus Paceibacterota bacterium]